MSDLNRRPTPSFITFALVLIIAVLSITVHSFSNWPGPLRISFPNRDDDVVMGFDFSIPYRVSGQLIRRETIYQSYNGAYPNYDYLPQSLLFVLPFTLFPLKTAYYILLVVSLSALWALFLRIGRSLGSVDPWWYALIFPIIVLFSQPGIYLYDRANLETIGAVFIYGALLAWLVGRTNVFALLIALATCLKPVYIPFLLFFLFMKERKRLLLIFAGVHAIVYGIVSLIYGSPLLLLRYFQNLGDYLTFTKEWTWDMNVGILSWLSNLFPSSLTTFMTLKASLVVLFLLCAGAIAIRLSRQKKSSEFDRLEGAVYFILLAFITTLWQFVSFAYGSLILLLTLPLADRLYPGATSRWTALLLICQSVFLGLIFSVTQPSHSPLGLRTPYYLLALLCWSFILIRMPAQNPEVVR